MANFTGQARSTGATSDRSLANNNQIVIANENLQLQLAPDCGAGILGFAVKLADQWVPIMRETPAECRSSSDQASFAMVPYPNRISQGKFEFDGQIYQLKQTEKHAIHGDVRDRPWKLVSQSANHVTVSFSSKDHKDFNFPFPFTAEMTYRLAANKLITEFKIKNSGERSMPAGFGFHPYFRKTLNGAGDQAELQFKVAGTYPFAGSVPLPEGPARPLKPEEDFETQRPINTGLDHCYSGWSGQAAIYWPVSKVRLTMQADPIYSHLVLYTPDKDFFALEPQTQMIDGVNFLGRDGFEPGVVILEPGQELAASFSLRVDLVDQN